MFIEKVVLILNFFKYVILSVNGQFQHDSDVFNSNTFRGVSGVKQNCNHVPKKMW